MKNIYVVMVVLIALSAGGLGGTVIEDKSIFYADGYVEGYRVGKIAGLVECPVPECSGWNEGYKEE